MPIVRAQVNLPRLTALPEDVSINTWHFLVGAGAALDAQITLLHTALTNFYNAIDVNLSSVLGTIATVKYYDLALPQPNPPVSTRNITMVLGSGTPLPEECAIALSFSGPPLAGAIAARRRGRIFIGPLLTSAVSPVAGRALVNTSVVTNIAQAGQDLLIASNASAEWSWVVYSPTNAAAGGTQDDWVTPVTHGWVDNAFDTIRSRGPAAQARQVFA